MRAGVRGGQKRAAHLPGLELKVPIGCELWVPETKLGIF